MTRRVEVTTREWVQPTPGVNGHWKVTDPLIATFHQFGAAYEEFENGAGNYTVAIVEMADGSVQGVPFDLIRFID